MNRDVISAKQRVVKALIALRDTIQFQTEVALALDQDQYERMLFLREGYKEAVKVMLQGVNGERCQEIARLFEGIIRATRHSILVDSLRSWSNRQQFAAAASARLTRVRIR